VEQAVNGGIVVVLAGVAGGTGGAGG